MTVLGLTLQPATLHTPYMYLPKSLLTREPPFLCLPLGFVVVPLGQ